MSGLGPEASAFLEAGSHGDEPTDADRERIRAAIAARVATGAAAGLAAAAGATVGAAAGGSTASAWARLGWAAKALVAVGFVGTIGAGAASLLRAPPRRPTSAVSSDPHSALQEASRVTAADSTSTEAADGPTPTLSSSGFALAAPAPSAWAAPSRRVPAMTGDVAAEVRLLSDAQAAVRGGDAARALALLDEHAQRYPKGALGEERDAARVAALCALGRNAEARTLADRFLRTVPDSPHAGPMRASCAGAPKAP
jgi:hypothetical protein